MPRAFLARRGWRGLVADAPEPASFQALLRELRAEDVSHTWRWLAPRGGLRELLAAEGRARPGVVYAYYARLARGGRELVAAAAVADRVSRRFRGGGWPVIARGYVRRRYRGDGLYRAMLAHRARACRRAWGGRLEAVHLGSSNPRVWRVALAGAGGLRFVPLGRERLAASPGRRRTVRAFAAFPPAFARRLRAEAAADPGTRRLVAALLAGRFRPGDHARLAAARRAAGGRRPALDRLLGLCAAIPLWR